MNRTLFVLIAIGSLFSFSCKKSSVNDPSLDLAKYLEMGIPDPGKLWNIQDFSAAYGVLLKLKHEQPFTLPRKTSDKSGVIYHRIISLDNMTFLKDGSLPLHEKANMLKQYLRVYWDGIDIYTNIRMKKLYYHRELLGLHIFGLSVAQKMLDLADKINESKDLEDVKMQSGHASVQGIYKSILMDVLRVQSSSSKYVEHDLEVLGDSISVSVMRNRAWMDSTDIQGVNLGLNVVIDSTSSSYIRKKYAELIKL